MVLTRQKLVAAAFVLVEVAAFLVVLGGCELLSHRRGPKSFRHEAHVAKGITCDACHYDFETQSQVGMPVYKTCFACHGPTRKRDSYPFELELQKRSPEVAFQARPRFYDLRFSHAAHFQRNVPCVDCHRDLDDPETRVTNAEFCRGCHRREAVGSNCSICHQQMRKDRRPPSHAGPAWRRLHGRTVASGLSLAHRESCNLCHSQGYCNNCHRVEKPQDHTEFFRQRGHGIRVGIERERCMACHQENFCVRCHRDTQPRSHFTSVWGGQISNHCLRCHEPLGESRCSVCHRGTPSHLGATPIPPPPHPSAASNCYTCHLRPPHADNGMPCTFCHM